MRIWILTKSEREFVGTLAGFDMYHNLVLENAKEFIDSGHGGTREEVG